MSSNLALNIWDFIFLIRNTYYEYEEWCIELLGEATASTKGQVVSGEHKSQLSYYRTT